jgi:Cu+-exporting ATPase
MDHDHLHAKSVTPEGAETAKDTVCGMTATAGPDIFCEFSA